MSSSFVGTSISPAEGEYTVRQYHTTRLSSGLLRLKADGYLIVTNKRVIFYASGTSYSGRSVLQSEVPIADVSGISSYKGTYFSLKYLFVAILISWIAIFFVGSIVTTLAVVVLPQLLGSQESRGLPNLTNISSNLGYLQIVPWIIAAVLTISSVRIPSKKIWRPVLASIAFQFAVIAGSIGTLSNTLGAFLSREPSVALVILTFVIILTLGVYALICCFLYARRSTMSIAIGSRGGGSTPIAISGIASFGLYNSAALKALSAEPAEQAESMIAELGAMITDIQTLGDAIMQKWRITTDRLN